MTAAELRRIQRAVRERLHARQIQAGKYGVSADPVITIEQQELHEVLRLIDLVLGFWPYALPQVCQALEVAARDVGIFIDLREQERAI